MSTFLFLEKFKKSENQVHWWVTSADGDKLDIWVKQWRIPQPWPRRILVHVCDASADMKYETADADDPCSLERGITALVRKSTKRPPVNSIRFEPVGDSKKEIGSPYIPHALLPNPSAEILKVQIWWDWSAAA